MKAKMFLLSAALLCASHSACAVEPEATEQSVTNEQSVATEPPVTKAQVLEAIAVLQTNAASDAGVKASYKIVRFAQESHTVTVRLNPDTVPWADAKLLKSEDAVRRLLLAAYIGGSAKAQLTTPQKAVDDPYEGWRLAIDVYRQIQQLKPYVVLREIDALEEKQTAGELKHYATEIQNKKPTP